MFEGGQRALLPHIVAQTHVISPTFCPARGLLQTADPRGSALGPWAPERRPEAAAPSPAGRQGGRGRGVCRRGPGPGPGRGRSRAARAHLPALGAGQQQAEAQRELLEGVADGEARLADAHGLHHARVAQLPQAQLPVEELRAEGRLTCGPRRRGQFARPPPARARGAKQMLGSTKIPLRDSVRVAEES